MQDSLAIMSSSTDYIWLLLFAYFGVASIVALARNIYLFLDRDGTHTSHTGLAVLVWVAAWSMTFAALVVIFFLGGLIYHFRPKFPEFAKGDEGGGLGRIGEVTSGIRQLISSKFVYDAPENPDTVAMEAEIWTFVFNYMRIATIISNLYLFFTWKKTYPTSMNEWAFIAVYLVGDLCLLQLVAWANIELRRTRVNKKATFQHVVGYCVVHTVHRIVTGRFLVGYDFRTVKESYRSRASRVVQRAGNCFVGGLFAEWV